MWRALALPFPIFHFPLFLYLPTFHRFPTYPSFLLQPPSTSLPYSLSLSTFPFPSQSSPFPPNLPRPYFSSSLPISFPFLHSYSSPFHLLFSSFYFPPTFSRFFLLTFLFPFPLSVQNFLLKLFFSVDFCRGAIEGNGQNQSLPKKKNHKF